MSPVELLAGLLAIAVFWLAMELAEARRELVRERDAHREASHRVRVAHTQRRRAALAPRPALPAVPSRPVLELPREAARTTQTPAVQTGAPA